jgi:hypothetical protein
VSKVFAKLFLFDEKNFPSIQSTSIPPSLLVGKNSILCCDETEAYLDGGVLIGVAGLFSP